MDELMHEVRRFQRYTERIQALMVEAQSQAPERNEGRDPKGAIHVVLGPDGTPVSISVAADWKQRVRPQEFSRALTEACEAAMFERLTVWGRALEDAGWRTKAERLQADYGREQLPDTGLPDGLPPALRSRAGEANPRPLDVVTEDMIAAFDGLNVQGGPQRVSGSGSGAGGRLTITLNPTGFESCTVDERWLAGQPAGTLNRLLGKALAEAHADLEHAPQNFSPWTPTAMNSLFGEAMALLEDPNRPTR